MSNTNKDLGEYTNIVSVIKEFNNRYKGVYSKLTKSKAINICKANGIPLFSFSQKVSIRSRIYVPKSLDLESLVGKDLFQVFVPQEEEKHEEDES